MQNKGAIKFLIYTLIIVALYQLSFTFVALKIKSDAKQYGGGNYAKEVHYLDSMQNQKVYNLLVKNFTLKECLDRQINLGLDLQGGMNIMLQVNVPSLVRELSNNSADPVFNQAFGEALTDFQSGKGDFIDLLQIKFEKLVPNNNYGLAAIFANSPQLRGIVDFSKTNEEIIAVLKDQSKSSIDNIFNVLRTRIDRFGVTQPNIQQIEGKRGRILVELPGIKDEKRVQKLLEQSAALDFYLTYEASEVWPILERVDVRASEILASKQNKKDSSNVVVDTNQSLLQNIDTTKTLLDTTKINEDINKHPLLSRIYPAIDQNKNIVPGPLIGFVQAKDTAEINKILQMPQINSMLPKDLKFAWTVKPSSRYQAGGIYELVALKTTPQGNSQLGGEVILNAVHNFDQNRGSAEVSMTMTPSAAQKWADLTGQNIGKSIAIVLDDEVYSYPTVQGKITGGVSQITGNFTIEEAQDLANVLKSGKLPIKIDIIELNHVGPSLGKESINSSVLAFIAAFFVILLYMVLYYNRAGFVSTVALLVNLFLIIGVLASLGAVLTLPGIAGLILTIGTAVDANVIINERVFEEIKSGKSLKKAITDGYSNSYSAIIDANVTTLITGIILYSFGHGPIQGFATTLIIGILTSLLSAIFVTRLIFEGMLNKEKNITFFSKFSENILTKTKVDFIKIRKIAYIFSTVVIIVGIASIFLRGFDMGIDFVGGRTYVMRFDNKVNTLEMTNILEKEFGTKPEVKTYGGDNQVRITTKYKINVNDAKIDQEIKEKFYNSLKPYLADKTYEQFESGVILSQQVVGPTIAKDIKTGAAKSVLFALIAIFLYIFIRFSKWQFSLGATVALVHDTLFTLSLFSLLWGILPFSLEIDQAFIAAILTVIGYSVNDTVIVFDRIRENLGLHPKRSLIENMNISMNQTLRRTLNTALTTIFTLLILFIFGGTVLRGFVFAITIGIIIGTYSSIFIATPVAFDTMKKAKLPDNTENK